MAAETSVRTNPRWIAVQNDRLRRCCVTLPIDDHSPGDHVCVEPARREGVAVAEEEFRRRGDLREQIGRVHPVLLTFGQCGEVATLAEVIDG